jgi:hypothetical protein
VVHPASSNRPGDAERVRLQHVTKIGKGHGRFLIRT